MNFLSNSIIDNIPIYDDCKTLQLGLQSDQGDGTSMIAISYAPLDSV